MKKSYLSWLLLFLIYLAASFRSNASHLMGSDIAYECLGNGKYRVVMTLYRDCLSSTALGNTISYRYGCVSTTGNTRNATRMSSTDVTGINPACNIASKCQSSSSSFGYGIQKHIYVDTINVSSLSCCEIFISYTICCRNSNISTGSADQDYYTEAKLNKCSNGCNSSPKYTTEPVALFCKDQDIVFNNGALDTLDAGDSLSYELAPGLRTATANISYSGSFSYLRPLTFAGFPNQNAALPNGFHLDPSTGDLRFRPTVLNQVSVISLLVREYRKDNTGTWVQIGITRRDLQVIIINCVSPVTGQPNSLPTVVGPANTQICAGDSVCVKYSSDDQNTSDTVRLSWNGGIPGASFTIINAGMKRDTALICWRPRETDTSTVPYPFTIKAEDKFCPLPGSSISSFSIQVNLKPRTTMSFTVDTCGLVRLFSNPASFSYVNVVYDWKIRDSTRTVIYRNSSDRTSNYVFLGPGKYYVSHSITNNNLCSESYSDSFVVLPFPVVRANLPQDTLICANSPITLNAEVQGGTSPYRYRWNTSAKDTFSTLNVSPSTDSLLIITVTDKVGCYHRDTVEAYVIPLPVPPLADIRLCSYDTLTLDGLNTSDARNYLWSTGQTSQKIKVFDPGSYWVKITDTFNCVNADTMVLQKNFLTLELGPPIAKCHYDSLTISVDSGDTHAWRKVGAAAVISSTKNLRIKLIDTGNVRYCVEVVKTQNGVTCYFKDTLNIRVNPLPKISFPTPTGECLNKGMLSLSANVTGLDSARWVSVQNPALIINNAYFNAPASTPGNYTIRLIAIDTNGCVDSSQYTQTIYAKPTAAFIINDSSQCRSGNSFVFTNQSSTPSGTLTYNWNFGDETNSSSASPVHTYTNIDTFLVTLYPTNVNSCRDTVSRKIIVFPQMTPFFTYNDSDQCLGGNLYNLDASGSTIPHGTIQNYAWNYGDNTSGSSVTTQKSYGAFGNYTIKLKITSAQGCTDSISRIIRVDPQTNGVIGVNSARQCLSGNLFKPNASLSTVGAGSISSYRWSYGDGDTAMGVQPSDKSYLHHDTFTIRLLTLTDKGCADSFFTRWVVHPQMRPEITISDSNQCLAGNQVTLSGINSQIPYGNIATYQWDMNDGNQLGGMQVNYSYTYSDTFSIKLKTISAVGCSDSVNQKIIIHPKAVLNIAPNNPAQCLSLNSFTFNAQASSIAWGTIDSLSWLYEDGTTDTGWITQPHSFSVNDTYDIRLRTVSYFNCSDTLVYKVAVHPQTKVAFTLSDSARCLDGNRFIFNGGGSFLPYGNILSYDWKYSDGGQANGIISPPKNFATFDTFDIWLYTTTGNGCKDSLMHQVAVHPQTAVNFSVSDSSICYKGHSISFDGSYSYLPYGNIATFAWDFADASTASTVLVPDKRFPAFGTYPVRLTTVTGNNCRDSFTRKIVIHPQSVPAINVVDSVWCVSNNQYILSAQTSSVPLGTISRYYWKFDDGSDYTGSFVNLKTYTYYDTFNVSLELTTDKGCLDTLIRKIIVFPQPNSAFNVNDSIQCFDNRHSFSFDAGASGMPDGWGSITDFSWHFSDGETRNGLTTANKTFVSRGTYDVKLIATSSDGCKDSVTRKVLFYPAMNPVIDVNKDKQCFNDHEFYFNALASTIPLGTINVYDWKFEDATYDRGIQSSLKTFATADTFSIWLVTTSNENCQDSVERDVILLASPLSLFDTGTVCLKQPYNVINRSTISSGFIDQWEWNLGDNFTTDTSTPVHYYKTPGRYNIYLKTTSNNGCEHDTLINNAVYIRELPVAKFNFEKTDYDFSSVDVKFNDLSTNPVYWEWDFGDATSSLLQNPLKNYSDTGTFMITLIVENNLQCRDTSSQSMFFAPDYDIFFPNVFTPNGDNLNNVFRPMAIQYWKKYNLKIYNRWGQIMFETSEHNAGWDGNYMNIPCPDGVYVYVFEAIDIYDEHHKNGGNVILLR